jgi:hypothetical protein
MGGAVKRPVGSGGLMSGSIGFKKPSTQMKRIKPRISSFRKHDDLYERINKPKGRDGDLTIEESTVAAAKKNRYADLMIFRIRRGNHIQRAIKSMHEAEAH